MMDQLFTRLEEASHAGDVNALRELLKKDKLLLERVMVNTSVRDNPVHIASVLGHATFVHEVLRRKPELAKEPDSQGLSPLHLAAAHGHVAVVKELLKTSFNLCLLSEKHNGLLPLHIAVIKGRAAVVEVLVEACEEALHKRTNGGETILHLAVRYNTFDTVEFLIDRMRDLNAKDNKGNSILHLAMTSKQLPVIKFLLSKAKIDINAMNLKFSTPLDVLLESRPEHGDLVIGEMIRATGGKTAAEVLSKSEPVIIGINSPTIDSSNPKPPQKTSLQPPHSFGTAIDIEEGTSEAPKEKNISKYNPDVLLVVATLVATVTFQAALNPPGGVQPDDGKHHKIKGQAVHDGSFYLTAFILCDMLALFSSVSVILLFLCVVPRKNKMVIKFLVGVVWIAALSMSMAFTMGIFVIYENHDDDGNQDDNISHNNQYTISASVLMFRGWFALFRLGISWVLVRFLYSLLKHSNLRKPLLQVHAWLKRECFLLCERLKSKNKWSRLCGSLKIVCCIVLIICVLVTIGLVWWSYKLTEF